MVRALMQAHALLGHRAEALRAYDAVKNALTRELGVEPLSETTESVHPLWPVSTTNRKTRAAGRFQ